MVWKEHRMPLKFGDKAMMLDEYQREKNINRTIQLSNANTDTLNLFDISLLSK